MITLTITSVNKSTQNRTILVCCYVLLPSSHVTEKSSNCMIFEIHVTLYIIAATNTVALIFTDIRRIQ
jgi:hypothetical protein